jgi:hypothetical protein
MKNIALKITFSFLAAVLCASVLATEEQSQPSGNKNVAIGPEVQGCRLEVSTTNRMYRVGEPIVLTASLQNLSSNMVGIPLGEQGYSIKVIGPDGRSVPGTEFRAKVWAQRHYRGQGLGPGQSLAVCFPLPLLFAMTNAGEYSIDVSRAVVRSADMDDVAWVPSTPLRLKLGGVSH